MVSYHTGPCLFDAIASVLSQDGLDTLVLVNNGNPEDVEDALFELEEQQARMKLLSGHDNIGFAKSCNLGAMGATSPYICLLNPDCLLPDGALRTLMQALENHPNAWLAGPKLTNADGSEQRGSRRRLLTPQTAWAEMFRLDVINAERYPRLNLHHTPAPTHTTPIPAVSGACMMLPTTRYTQLGGLDTQYFLHVEDLDLCYRIHEAGAQTLWVPEVAVMHHRSTSDVPSLKVEWWKAQSFERYFSSHFADSMPRWQRLLLQAGVMARALIMTAVQTARAGWRMLTAKR